MADAKRWTATILSVLLSVGAARSAAGQVVTSTPCLPPSSGLGGDAGYIADLHSRYGPVELRNPVHSRFTSCLFPNVVVPQIESFGSQAAFDVSIFGSPFVPYAAPADVTVQVTFNHQSGNTQFFDAEMLQLDIGGGDLPPGVLLRESPTLPSLGQTTIEDLGGGLYRIESFFDIFTELSLDNGSTWIPGDGAARVTLQLIPEPASASLVGAALLALCGLGRRGHGNIPPRIG